MRGLKNFKAFFLFFGVYITFLWTSCCNAFILSAFHNGVYEMGVFMYHEPTKRWVQQYFDGDFSNGKFSLGNTQFLGLYRHKGRIFYLVYNFSDRVLRFLYHDVSALQDNYQNYPEHNLKKIILKSINITANDQETLNFSGDSLLHAEAVFSESDSDEDHVMVYTPSRIIKYGNLKKVREVSDWWNVDRFADNDMDSSTFMAFGLHQGNVYYVKNVKETKQQQIGYSFIYNGVYPPLERPKDERFFSRMAKTTLGNRGESYNEHEVLYFDYQKNVYASLGPLVTAHGGLNSKREMEVFGPDYVKVKRQRKQSIGMSPISVNMLGYRMMHPEEYPYPAFLNHDRKKYNVLSFENGLICMFADHANGKAVIYSSIGRSGHVNERRIDLNIEEKRSKLLLGDGAQRFIAVNNQFIYSSKDGVYWERSHTLPDSLSFQDVLWVETKDKR